MSASAALRKNPVRRNYRLADGRMIQLTDGILQAATRDILSLAQFGVTTLSIAAIATKRDAFSNIETDEEMVGLLIGATDSKIQKMNAVRLAIDPIVQRSVNKFGADHSNTMQFGGNAFATSDLSDDELVRTGRTVVRVATSLLGVLTSEGLTSTIITDLQTKVGALDTAIDRQLEAKQNRGNKTRDRINAGNDVYSDVVKLANYGKTAFVNVDEELYNDYIIVENENATGHVHERTLGAGEKANIPFEDIIETEHFRIQVTGDKPVTGYFSSSKTAAPQTGDTTVVFNPGDDVLKVSSEIGWDELKPFLNFINNNSDTTSVKVTRVDD